MVSAGACEWPGGGRVYFFAAGARRVFFLLWVRPCPGLGRSGGIRWGVARPAGGRVYFFAAGARRLFFLLWVRGRFAHSLAAGVGLGNPIGHGLRRGLCGAGGAARFFFCCGCALARGWAGQAESNGAWTGQPGGAFIFLLWVRGAFFFLLWVRGRFAHSLAAGVGLGNPIGHGLRRGLCRAGGARLFIAAGARRVFFCCGCALARGSAGQAESNGAWAGQPGGAFIFLLRVRGAFFFLLWVRGRFAHSLAAGAGLGNPIGHGLRRGS